jgi:hypothetical protein
VAVFLHQPQIAASAQRILHFTQSGAQVVLQHPADRDISLADTLEILTSPGIRRVLQNNLRSGLGEMKTATPPAPARRPATGVNR